MIMDKAILYKIKKSKRAKQIRIAVHSDGKVIVTSPFGIKESIVNSFISKKKQWIIDKVHFFNNVDKKYIKTFSKKDYLENKDKVLTLVSDRVDYYNKVYGFSFHSVSIKNQKTRWGSCSSRKNLNLNYKIGYLPTDIQDYIIVHELCHLKEFNHSKSFWALVNKTIPNYLEIKKELRKYNIREA